MSDFLFLWINTAAMTQKNADPNTMSKVKSSSVNFLTFTTKSNVFNKEFFSLAYQTESASIQEEKLEEF